MNMETEIKAAYSHFLLTGLPILMENGAECSVTNFAEFKYIFDRGLQFYVPVQRNWNSIFYIDSTDQDFIFKNEDDLIVKITSKLISLTHDADFFDKTIVSLKKALIVSDFIKTCPAGLVPYWLKSISNNTGENALYNADLAKKAAAEVFYLRLSGKQLNYWKDIFPIKSKMLLELKTNEVRQPTDCAFADELFELMIE